MCKKPTWGYTRGGAEKVCDLQDLKIYSFFLALAPINVPYVIF